MAELKTYAEVTSPDAVAAASGKEPGKGRWTAGRLLERTGEGDVVDAPLGPVLISQLHALSEITGDASYRAIAEGTTVKIAVGHLRGVHPDTDVRFGLALHYTPEEARALRLRGLA
jgi:hypothetical protein